MEKKTIKIFANISAFLVPWILIVPFLIRYFFNYDFTPEQYLGYAIGTASPLAALAGYLFVYLSFLHQSDQFQFDKNERVFIQYFKAYEKSINSIEYTSKVIIGNQGGVPIKGTESSKGKEALNLFMRRIKEWSEFEWPNQNRIDFEKAVGVSFIPKRQDFTMANATKKEAQMLLKAVSNEPVFGQYFTILNFLLDHSRKSEFPSFLVIFESSIGYEEKIFLFHYCPLALDITIVTYLKRNNFLVNISEKHWSKLFGNNYW